MKLSELRHPIFLYGKVVAKTTNAIYYRFGNILRRSIGIINRHNKQVHAFWWTGSRNFGDLITPLLLTYSGFIPILRGCSSAKLAAAGSILGMLPADYSAHVFGAGLLSENHRLRFPHAKIHAIRGALSRDCISAPSNVLLGDPGLLLVDILPNRASKRYELGLVPHYEDKGDPRLRDIALRYRKDTLIVDVQKGPLQVAQAIDQCRSILSSSLHGLVLADALGIPNAWAILSDRVYGNGFKFRDYYTAYGIERSPLFLTGNELLREIIDQVIPPPANILNVKNKLSRAWRDLCMELSADPDS